MKSVTLMGLKSTSHLNRICLKGEMSPNQYMVVKHFFFLFLSNGSDKNI